MGWLLHFMQQVSPSTTNKAFSWQSLMLLMSSFRMALKAFCVFLISPCLKRQVGSGANSNAKYNSVSLLFSMRSNSLCQRWWGSIFISWSLTLTYFRMLLNEITLSLRYRCISVYVFPVIDSAAAFSISNAWSQLTLESAITPVAKDTWFELLYAHEKWPFRQLINVFRSFVSQAKRDGLKS